MTGVEVAGGLLFANAACEVETLERGGKMQALLLSSDSVGTAVGHTCQAHITVIGCETCDERVG